MIWNSTPLMTAIDLLIMAVTIFAIWRCRLIAIGAGARPTVPRTGVLLITLGLLAICLFYFADLVIMDVLPAVTSMQEAMAAMETLHRNFSWPSILLAAIAISTGFIELLMELQKREARIRRLVDSNIIGIFIWGPDSRLIDANEAFLRILGYDRDDLDSGRLRWRELAPTQWRDADERHLAELKATGIAQPYEIEYLQKDGGRVPVLVGKALFEGRSEEGVAFVVDLTERRRAERAERESERRYHEIRSELAHANRVVTIGHMTSSIAHEVNQPIAATVINAETALRWLDAQPPNLEEVRETLGRIVKDGHRAGDIIERIRNLIKKAPARKESLEINKAILEVIVLSRGEAAKKRVSVQTQLAEGLPRIHGDRVQLQQVILNLIINAIDAMSDMGEQSRELLVSTASMSDGVLVAVRDSGPGLDAASIERLFEPFYTTKPGGLGMGLSICRSIIETHEGRLWAIANVPKGAIFQFRVPAHADSGDD
jgi:PAS domain S-box-containing protein